MVIIGHRSSKSTFGANNTKFSEEVLFSISDYYKTTAMDSSNKIVTQRVTHKISLVYNFQFFLWVNMDADKGLISAYLDLVSLNVNIKYWQDQITLEVLSGLGNVMQGRLV